MLRTGRILEHEYGNTFPSNVGEPVVPKYSQLAQILPRTIIIWNNYPLDVTKKQDLFINLNVIAKDSIATRSSRRYYCLTIYPDQTGPPGLR